MCCSRQENLFLQQVSLQNFQLKPPRHDAEDLPPLAAVLLQSMNKGCFRDFVVGLEFLLNSSHLLKCCCNMFSCNTSSSTSTHSSTLAATFACCLCASSQLGWSLAIPVTMLQSPVVGSCLSLGSTISSLFRQPVQFEVHVWLATAATFWRWHHSQLLFPATTTKNKKRGVV